MIESELRERLEKIEGLLGDIASRFRWPGLLLSGFLRGGGFVLGTVFSVAILGWVLSIAGIVPGFGEIVRRLSETLRANF